MVFNSATSSSVEMKSVMKQSFLDNFRWRFHHTVFNSVTSSSVEMKSRMKQHFLVGNLMSQFTRLVIVAFKCYRVL
jgi:hypothetical protein